MRGFGSINPPPPPTNSPPPSPQPLCFQSRFSFFSASQQNTKKKKTSPPTKTTASNFAPPPSPLPTHPHPFLSHILRSTPSPSLPPLTPRLRNMIVKTAGNIFLSLQTRLVQGPLSPTSRAITDPSHLPPPPPPQPRTSSHTTSSSLFFFPIPKAYHFPLPSPHSQLWVLRGMCNVRIPRSSLECSRCLSLAYRRKV